MKHVLHLRRARVELDAILDELDLSADTCGSCQSNHYNNWDDWNFGKKLQGMIEKIDGEIAKLEGRLPKRGKNDD